MKKSIHSYDLLKIDRWHLWINNNYRGDNISLKEMIVHLLYICHAAKR